MAPWRTRNHRRARPSREAQIRDKYSVEDFAETLQFIDRYSMGAGKLRDFSASTDEIANQADIVLSKFHEAHGRLRPWWEQMNSRFHPVLPVVIVENPDGTVMEGLASKSKVLQALIRERGE